MKKFLFYVIGLFISILNINAQVQILETTKTNVSCFSGNNGTVTVSVTGGEKPYFYSLQKSGTIVSSYITTDTIHTFTNVSANAYLVIVEDNLASGDIVNITVNQPSPVSITSTDIVPISCMGFMDGEIEVTANGESGSFIYTLNPLGISNATGSFPGLPPGNYTVTVTDAGGCPSSATTSPLLISDPMPLSVSVISSTSLTCKDAGNGAITAVATGGTGAYTFNLNPGSGPSNSDGIFTGLDAGIYSVEVTDLNGCPNAASPPVLISEPDELIITSENLSDNTCYGSNDGTITISAMGGTGPYTYTLQPDGSENSLGFFDNLAPGTYTIELNDALSCGPVLSNPLTITEPEEITVQSLLL